MGGVVSVEAVWGTETLSVETIRVTLSLPSGLGAPSISSEHLERGGESDGWRGT